MTGAFEDPKNNQNISKQIDYRSKLPELPGVICTGTISQKACDTTITIPAPPAMSSPSRTIKFTKTTTKQSPQVLEQLLDSSKSSTPDITPQPLATVQIKTTNPSVIKALQTFIKSNPKTQPEVALKALAEAMRLAHHTSQIDTNSLHQVTSSTQLLDYVEALRIRILSLDEDIAEHSLNQPDPEGGPQVDENPPPLLEIECMHWATTVLTACYEFDPATFPSILESTLPLQKAISDLQAIVLARQLESDFIWQRKYVSSLCNSLGPLAEKLLLAQLENSPHKQPRIHPSLISAFNQWCDTSNPKHLRIIGRLLPQSEGEHEESADIILGDLCDYNDENQRLLPLHEARKHIFQGLIEGGIPDLSLGELGDRFFFLAELAKGLTNPTPDYITLNREHLILDAFSFIPHEVVQAGIDNCPIAMIEQCLRRWDDIDRTSQELIGQVIASNPVKLFQQINLSSITLPSPIQDIVYQEKIFNDIWQSESSTIIRYVEVFPNLPEHALQHFIDANQIDVVMRNRGSFVWTNNSKQCVLTALLKAGDMKSIIQNMDFFPDTLFKRCCRNYPTLISFKHDSKVPLAEVYSLYDKTFHDTGGPAAKAVLLKAQEILDNTVSPIQITEDLSRHTLYPAIYSYAYSSNANYKLMSKVPDRTEDLELFELPGIEQLDLLAGKKMVLRDRVTSDTSLVNRLHRYINEPQRIYETSVEIEHDLQKRFTSIIDAHFPEMSGKSLEVAMLGALLTLEINPNNKHCRRLAVLFHAIKAPQFDQYARASQDRVDQAPNRDYAYLLELREFLETVVPDTIKESISRSSNEGLKVSCSAALADLFAEDIKLIDLEIRKYAPEGSTKSNIPRVSAFFAKNSQSAGMLFSAGVCVAGDVPREGLRYADDTMWSLENYFNLVFRDDDTKRCVGGVLLHYYEEHDKQILSASINPSSSLLYKTDEQRFFEETMRILISFAESNDIDMIVASTDSGIRTNRTGGLFEQALDAQIRKYNQKFNLPHEEIFSFNPLYYQQEFDVIWLAESSN